MTKPKRMSEILASSSEKDGDITIATTPPCSSDGPTLPLVGATDNENGRAAEPVTIENVKPSQAENNTKAEEQTSPTLNQRVPINSPSSIDPALYRPWTLLPPELLNLLESQNRFRKTQNIIPVVFSKNQNVKSGINRLKMYLGSDKNPASTIELPDALKLEDSVIAVSAQGKGTTKLISIVDMATRFVAPSSGQQTSNMKAERWWFYTMLTNIETERKLQHWKQETQGIQEEGSKTSAEDGSQDQSHKKEKDLEEANCRWRVPVLTVWITRQQILVFKDAFGENSFMTQGP